MNKGAIVEHIVNWTLLITLVPALILMLMDEFPVAIQFSHNEGK